MIANSFFDVEWGMFDKEVYHELLVSAAWRSVWFQIQLVEIVGLYQLNHHTLIEISQILNTLLDLLFYADIIDIAFFTEHE